MAQRNDQVFQLSLTEIAFTIAFILLLLLGYLVVKEQAARVAAEAALASVQTAERATTALDEAKRGLASALQGAGASNPDEVITRLINADEIRAERDQLRKQVDDLDAKLTALAELQKQLEKAAQSSRPDITREEVESAIALQEQVRKALDASEAPSPQTPQPSASKPPSSKASASTADSPSKLPAPPTAAAPKVSSPPEAPPASKVQRNKETVERIKQAILTTGELKKQLKAQLNNDLSSGQETGTIRDVVTAAKNYSELAKSGANPDQIKKENSDLRGQVAFLKNRLDARGGRDYPPCWADESGKVEFLFSVEVKPDSVVVSPAWPPRREAAARALPGKIGRAHV